MFADVTIPTDTRSKSIKFLKKWIAMFVFLSSLWRWRVESSCGFTGAISIQVSFDRCVLFWSQWNFFHSSWWTLFFLICLENFGIVMHLCELKNMSRTFPGRCSFKDLNDKIFQVSSFILDLSINWNMAHYQMCIIIIILLLLLLLIYYSSLPF